MEKSGPNIMIVDDKPANLLSLEALMESSDFEEITCCNIVKASSGNEALRLALMDDYAVILLDVQMPGMDGFETAEYLRTNSKTKHIPIVFVTALSKEDKHVFKGYESGAVDYLFKPIEPMILLSKVRIFSELYQYKATIRRQVKELEKARGALKIQAAHDSLTGILNRGAIMERLDEELSRCMREKNSLSVAMFDIDHFKKVNDSYGHQSGDLVLKECVNRIASGLRQYDILGRYGGEEFMIIIPGASLEQARGVCERIRKFIADGEMRTLEAKVSITASLGVATTDGKVDAESLLKAADRALYKAKDRGRNRVEFELC